MDEETQTTEVEGEEVEIVCFGCGGIIETFMASTPAKISCPNCGTEGLVD